MPAFFVYSHTVYWLCGYIIGALVLVLLDTGLYRGKHDHHKHEDIFVPLVIDR